MLPCLETNIDEAYDRNEEDMAPSTRTPGIHTPSRSTLSSLTSISGLFYKDHRAPTGHPRSVYSYTCCHDWLASALVTGLKQSRIHCGYSRHLWIHSSVILILEARHRLSRLFVIVLLLLLLLQELIKCRRVLLLVLLGVITLVQNHHELSCPDVTYRRPLPLLNDLLAVRVYCSLCHFSLHSINQLTSHNHHS